MSKRKFVESEEEDAQDQVCPSNQGSDDDYVPPANEGVEEQRSMPTNRATRARPRPAASAPPSDHGDEDEEESDSGSEADAPPMEIGNPGHLAKVTSGRVRKVGTTPYCGVISKRIKKPEPAPRTSGKFVCIICRSKFTRAEGVNYHFPRCVEVHGNPLGNRWNDHPSCASRKTRERPAAAGGNPRIPTLPPSARKRLRLSKPASVPSVVDPRNQKKTVRAAPVAKARAQATEQRVTRSKALRPRPDLGTVNIETPSVQKSKATKPSTSQSSTSQPSTSQPSTSQPSTSQPKRSQAKPNQKQKTSTCERPKPQPRSKDASGVGKRSKYEVGENLPPLHEPGPTFHDLTLNALNKTPLMEALKTLSDKQINIATMCSGTESPLLALAEIQNGLRLSGHPALNMKHLFSAEIVPYKQAYIERNFHPDLIFRDILEIAAGGQATTAYGALTDVPAGVDILVAGFACVDFSKLNKKSKKITDIGESSDTFRSILQYARRYRPKIIILENVEGAPWDLIRAIWAKDKEFMCDYFKANADSAQARFYIDFWDDDDLAYAAEWQRVDAKHYYIPQTRTRRYMICLDRSQFPSPELADEAAQEWKRCMVALERKASAPVEAFLLSEDDPRLQHAKDEMSKTGMIRRETDWEVCMGRHEDYRAKEKLGTSRPILEWTNDGCAKPCGYVWTEWTLSQVERIWDTIEISYLRNAAKAIDSFHKSRFWELSQNIDRFLDTTPEGVIGCLTPKGQQFSTIRGRPITGLEAIALQGLPIDVLLLTRESQRELIDLGGNAMTSTVVGAALISAFAVSHSVITRVKDSKSQPPDHSGLVATSMRFSELQREQALKFDGSHELSLEELSEMAKASVCLCHCEGQNLTTSALIRKCKRCHHHCCEKCGNMPKHDYELLLGDGAPLRMEPREFRKRVEQVLPTRLEIDGLTDRQLEAFAELAPGRSQQDWKIFSDAILLAFTQEYRYASIKRSHCWTITFKAASSRLELVFDRENIYWLLYGQADQSEAGNSPVRKILQNPLARMTIQGQMMRGGLGAAQSVLTGSWEIRLPITQTFPILVTPQGELTDSWEKKLGLQGEALVDKQVCTSLHIDRLSDTAAELVLDHDICGDYDLLENCGTACSSLHMKRKTADSHDQSSLFLFLDADRNGAPEHDSYVFSTDMHRLEYDESRYVTATVDNMWRAPSKGSDSSADFPVSSEVSCTVSSRWEPCSIFLRPHRGLEEASVRFPKGVISVPVFGTYDSPSDLDVDDVYGCLHGDAITALLSCVLPRQLADRASWQKGLWTIMNQKSERQVAATFAWLFAQVKDLGGFERGWRPLGSRPAEYCNCPVCAPAFPKIMWTCSRGSKKDKIIPYEDGREAGNFERKIKVRPAPFLVQTSVDDDEMHAGRLLVGLHLPTLVHRALARLKEVANSDEIDMQWRLDTQWEAPNRYRLKDFTLTNNKLHAQANYSFPTGEQLRPEQKRSLHWMIGQEADDMAFYEEEIEEATLSQMSWRAEVRIRRARIVRGGVLADEVGYGKTATTLALIDTRKRNAEDYARCQSSGRLSIKATLILVPHHLIHQWKGQAKKFLGMQSDDDRILVIENIVQLTSTSVRRIKKALIVLVSWQLFNTSTYMARMSHFAALPMAPASGGREIEAWLTRACENTEKHMDELVDQYESPKDFAEVLKERLQAAHNDETILRDVPTQRLKGAKYKTWNPAECVTPVDPAPKGKALESCFKHMADDLNSMTGILLHMFDFYRVVIDEYTYAATDEKLTSYITTINARSRWVLSGTPSIQDFGDVHNLARFLACNLGIVDDAAGVVKGATIRSIRDHRTAAEQFRAFGFSHTADWHIERQAYGQKFLDKYASKNIPEIGLIKSILHLRPHFLGSTETIPNAELQQQLQSSEMKLVLQGKNKKDNDRLRRYKALLRGCKTASECLIRSCSYFEMGEVRHPQRRPLGDAMDIDDVDAPSGTCQSLITIREREMNELAVDLEHNLLHAEWLERQCRRAIKVEHRGSHYLGWKSDMEKTGLKDPTATAALHRFLAAATRRLGPGTEDIYYRDPPTQEQLQIEKKAADERKKQEKAKRAADRKAKKLSQKSKKPTKRRTIASADDADADSIAADDYDGDNAHADEDDAEDSESIHGDDVDPSLSDPKPSKIGRDDYQTFNSELRALTGHLRGLVTELTSRTRSLRFARGAQELQQWHTGRGKPPSCQSCGRLARNPEDISINIRCGHHTCAQCIQMTTSVACAVDGCGEGAEAFRLRKAVDLVGDGKTWRYGSRLGYIIALINSLPEDDQVLLFVQFEDLMLNMAEALEAANISNYALSKSAGRHMSTMMNDFQDNHGKNKKKVLLLNPASETASGINLTNVNHIIFASPLLTRTQQSYDASMTQCIGRAKRYGQQKTVHVYRFVALRTADVDILQEREQMTLVRKQQAMAQGRVFMMGGPARRAPAVEWQLVSHQLMDGTMEAGWGSGFDFRSNPAEEDD